MVIIGTTIKLSVEDFRQILLTAIRFQRTNYGTYEVDKVKRWIIDYSWVLDDIDKELLCETIKFNLDNDINWGRHQRKDWEEVIILLGGEKWN